jgi:hypothetical protein
VKLSLRYAAVAAFGIALTLLLAGWIGVQEVRRQNVVKSTRFIEQYAGVVQQLRGNMDSVQKKMRMNEVAIPASVAEVLPEPVPILTMAEKDRIFVLQGISWSVESPLVMIEDRIYKPGDQIGGFTIQEILPRAVILRNANGVQSELTLIREDQS